MPAAGKAVHVRRLLVVRARCGLEVSPTSPSIQMVEDHERGLVVAIDAAKAPVGECGVENQVGWVDVVFLFQLHH